VKDKDYFKVKFDWDTFGMMAEHRGHNPSSDHGKTFFGGLSSAALERECQKILYEKGYSAVLENEVLKGRDGNYLPVLDTTVNGVAADIKSCTENVSSYRNMLMAKNKQITRLYKATGKTTDTVILYFHDASMFELDKVAKGIREMDRELKKYHQKRHVEKVICVVSDGRIVTWDK
jgi:hypothetical protein